MKSKLLFILLFGLALISCNKEDNVTSEQNLQEYAEEVVFRTQETTNLGKFGCYDLVFPVKVSFIDATSVEVNSYEELKNEVIEWRKENPRVRTKPQLSFPYDIVNEDGELITVDNITEQRQLRLECRRDFFVTNGFFGHNNRPKLCFKLEYPFTLVFNDGVKVIVEKPIDRKILHTKIKEFKKLNPGVRIKTNFVYPLNVKLEDGKIVTVNSQDELKELIRSCK